MSPHPWHVGGVDLPDGPLIIGQDPRPNQRVAQGHAG